MTIVGGGPAGISAAIWCAELGVSSLILESADELFGQLHTIHNPIENYPGISARNGAEMIKHFRRSISRSELRAETGVSISAVNCNERTVKLDDGRSFNGRILMIATGVRRKTLGVPGEERFQGKGILQSGARERESVKGKRVVVVGGGDAAVENALILAEFAEEVTLIHRREKLAARDEFLKRAATEPKIQPVLETEVTEIVGDERVSCIEVRSTRSGIATRIKTDFFIARIGYAPNSELVSGQLDSDLNGYLTVDNECRTGLPGVYAVGDVACPISPTIATAVGMGATAAKSAFSLLTSKKTV